MGVVMKATEELKQLADELGNICNQGIGSDDPGWQILYSSQARAKGNLLLRKLGSFGDVWKSAFEPGDNDWIFLRTMLGTAHEISDALSKDRLSTVEELVSATILGDLVEHAEALIDQSYFLAAAVVLRAALEERLRKLCVSNNLAISVSKPTIEHFRQALAQAGVFDKVIAKKVDWMAGVGNAAAHNLPSFNPSDVPDLYKSTLDLFAKFTP